MNSTAQPRDVIPTKRYNNSEHTTNVQSNSQKEALVAPRKCNSTVVPQLNNTAQPLKRDSDKNKTRNTQQTYKGYFGMRAPSYAITRLHRSSISCWDVEF